MACRYLLWYKSCCSWREQATMCSWRERASIGPWRNQVLVQMAPDRSYCVTLPKTMVGDTCTAIPNRELQGFYREIWVQGNSNYMLWQCTGFAGSIFVVKKGIPCIYYWISFDFITLTFMQSLNEFPCKISLLQGKACNGEMETNVMLTLLFYVAITGKIM